MKTLLSIVGPTATGKTRLSVFLAEQFHTEILSFDSRQCYQELNIGTAKPTVAEMHGIPHHFIHSHSIQDESFNVKVFADYAAKTLASLFLHHDIVIAVGGTGFFWDAIFYDFNEIPPIDQSVRTDIKKDYEHYGFEWLKKELQVADPLFFLGKEIKNPQRMMRALEVKRTTGLSIVSFQRGRQKKNLDFKAINIGLRYPDSQMRWDTISRRAADMMRDGLQQEVECLQSYLSLNALNTTGYKEWIPFFEHKITVDDVLHRIISNTNNYAKRQMTWFKKNPSLVWFQKNTAPETILDHINLNL